MAYQSQIDWVSIRAEYESGTQSIRQIAKRHGVSDTAIRRRASDEGWVRSKAQGSQQGSQQLVHAAPAVAPNRVPEPGTFIERARREAETLLTELEDARRHLDLIEFAIDEETKDDVNGRRRSMMLKAVSLPSRTLTFKTLAQALNTIAEIEGAKGKKEQTLDRAKATAVGRFAAPAPPPKLAIDNTK
ncbi:MAG: hypothetical protein F8N39_07245 [Clostridiaceae bacterium]|nr:hypothetical protein [Clostridiaceae bacterium]